MKFSLVFLLLISTVFPKVSLIFRYDDFSGASPLEIEKVMIDIFSQNEVSIVLGLTPFLTEKTDAFISNQAPLDLKSDTIFIQEEKFNFLRKIENSNQIEIALHGTTHQRRKSGKKSEFEGVPHEVQFQTIKAAKDYLENQLATNIVTFIPPWNSYDKNTVQVLDSLGFNILSGSTYGSYYNSDLSYLPYTVQFDELDQAIELAKNHSGSALIVCMLHPYDFLEVDKKRGQYTKDQLNQKLKQISGDSDIETGTFVEVFNSGKFPNSLDYSIYSKIRMATPSFYNKSVNSTGKVYHDLNGIFIQVFNPLYSWIFLIAAFFLILSLIAFMFHRFILSGFVKQGRYFLLSIFMIIPCLYLFPHFEKYWAVCFLSVWAGFLASYLSVQPRFKYF